MNYEEKTKELRGIVKNLEAWCDGLEAELSRPISNAPTSKNILGNLLSENDIKTEYFKEEETGFVGAIYHHRMGHLCGYVGVPKGHPYFKKGYDYAYEMDDKIECHGGLTYAGYLEKNERVGWEDHWFLGFDCAHAGDIVPSLNIDFGEEGSTYKDENFVRAEIKKLAKQIARAK